MNKRGARRLTALLLTAAFMLIMLPAGGLTMTYTPSSSYASGQYYTRLRAVQLTGNQRQDLVNVALSQLGYHEGNSASQLGGNSTSGEYDYTEYGYWYGKIVLGRDSGLWGAWCAMFVSWCSRQAGISKNIISNACYAHAGSSTYYFNNLTFRERGTYTPVPGDLVFFDWPNQEGEWNHVGIVYVVTSSFVYTIEGNTLHDCVEIRCFRITEPIIKGYGVPAYTSSGTVTPSVSVNNIPVYDYYDPINHAKPKGTISNGTSGEGTSWLQCALNYLGYPLTIDGEFGSATEAALRAFQADHGLTVNGICTLAVVNYIQSLLDAYNTPTPTPTPTPTASPDPTETTSPDDPSNYPVPTRNLKLGCTGDDVKWLQAALTRLGYPLTIDGIFGNNTYNAVVSFQTDNGLTPDGICGPLTRAAIIALLEAMDTPVDPTPSPDPTPTPEPTIDPTEPPADPTPTPEPTIYPTEPPAAPTPTPEPTIDPTEPPADPMPTPEPTIDPTEPPVAPTPTPEPTIDPTEPPVDPTPGPDPTEPPDGFMPGDVNGDGEITATDALLTLRHALGLEQLEGEALAAADYDGDGEVTSTDALLILRAFIVPDRRTFTARGD